MVYRNTPYFDAFPKIQYDINNTGFGAGSHETVTDIFFRMGIIKDVLNNITSYYVYELDDSDTPEILAEKVYGDIGAGWIILYANKILDPQFEWPLNYDAFSKMLIDRYGSIENSKTEIHHYEKVIKRTNEFTGITTEYRYVIDPEKLTDDTPDVPYSYWEPGFPSYTDSYSIDGKTVTETISGEAVTNYEYELRKNDAKRLIKVIKSEYYSLIINEFARITGTTNGFVRRLI